MRDNPWIASGPLKVGGALAVAAAAGLATGALTGPGDGGTATPPGSTASSEPAPTSTPQPDVEAENRTNNDPGRRQGPTTHDGKAPVSTASPRTSPPAGQETKRRPTPERTSPTPSPTGPTGEPSEPPTTTTGETPTPTTTGTGDEENREDEDGSRDATGGADPAG